MSITRPRAFGIGLLVCMILAGIGRTAPEEDAALPQDCLAAGTLEEADVFLARMGAVVSALDPEFGTADLRQNLGGLLHNPALAGVDLSVPIRFYWMSPGGFPRAWVFQFGVRDANALRQASETRRPQDKETPAFLRLSDDKATWSESTQAAEALLAWQARHSAPVSFRVGGQWRMRLDVARTLQAFPQEFARQVQAMKDRMREALEGRGKPDKTPLEVAAAQAQLDIVACLIRQVRDAEFGVEMRADRAVLAVKVTPLPGTPLHLFFRDHPAGDLSLPSLCPADAALVVAHNLTIAATLQTMATKMLGWESLEKVVGTPVADGGRRLTALFLAATSGGPVEFLDLRAGRAADDARKEWENLLNPAGSRPVSLRALPTPGPATTEDFRLAEIVPNRETLGPAGDRAYRRFLGPDALAAQERNGAVVATAVGANPGERLRQVNALVKGIGDSLAGNMSFADSLKSLSGPPNVLFYASPEGVRRWLALGGFVTADSVKGEPGLCGVVRFTESGMDAGLALPTAILKRPVSTGPR